MKQNCNGAPGYSTDETDAALHENIVAAKYAQPTGSEQR
jgi:hypothetical protein